MSNYFVFCIYYEIGEKYIVYSKTNNFDFIFSKSMFSIFLRLAGKSSRPKRSIYLSMSAKKGWNEWHLYLVTHIFTKLSQNVSLINTHFLMYWYARCNRKLWRVPQFYCVFLVFYDNSCLNCFIFTKHSLIVYLNNVHILVCYHSKYVCRLCKVLWFNDAFFGNFHILRMF